jgi:hypothetical protein
MTHRTTQDTARTVPFAPHPRLSETRDPHRGCAQDHDEKNPGKGRVNDQDGAPPAHLSVRPLQEN